MTPPPTTTAERTVVAVVVEWRGRIGLFRRSAAVAHDRGRWHCITGYVDPGHTPEAQALQELHEETGLRAADLTALSPGPVLRLEDDDHHPWVVHTFRASTVVRRLQLNEEHDSYRWTAPAAVARFDNRVGWLDQVLEATGR